MLYHRRMSPRPAKHSLTLHGHRTSISLEPEFWEAFRAIAADQGRPLNALAAEIDDSRAGDAGLASAIRVFVLNHYRAATRPSVTARSP
jgi:predicted DNA-binding ribbon-helix-helix protein